MATLEAFVKSDPSWLVLQDSYGPAWDIRFNAMADFDEAIDWRNKIIWLAAWRWPDPLFRAAHAFRHVHAHAGASMFTEEMCQEADEFATFWVAMTRDGSAPPILAA
jgi:hypothetical protein